MTGIKLSMLDDIQLSKISGGQEYISDENAMHNVLNYYINF